MMLPIKLLVLATLLRVLLATEKSFLCAAIYTIAASILNFAFAPTVLSATLSSCAIFVLANVYFWILNQLDCSSIFWWCIAIPGAAMAII